MIKCKIKLTDGSNESATLPEADAKGLLKFLNAPSSGGTSKLGDFMLLGDHTIINRHEIVKITIEGVEDDVELKEDETTKITSHVHKEKNPNGPKRSSE